MTLYEKVRDDLLAKIHDGTYRVGEVIPPEVELAKSYGVSRPTVRQAIQLLANEGYLERRRKRGTIVTKPKIDQSFVMGVGSFVDQTGMVGRRVDTNVLLFRREKANREVSDALELELGGEVYKLVRLRYVDGVPNVFVVSYVPCAWYPDFEDFDFGQTRLYAAMGKRGKTVVKAHRRLETIKADHTNATLLDVAPGDPLLLFHTVGRDEDGRAVEYSIATYRGEDNAFEFEVSSE